MMIRILEKISRGKDTKITQFDNGNQKLRFLHVISLRNGIILNSIFKVERKFFSEKFFRIWIPRLKNRGICEKQNFCLSQISQGIEPEHRKPNVA